MSSKNRRGGLGRGLGALIPTAPSEPAPHPEPDQAGGYPAMPPYDAGTERDQRAGEPVGPTDGGSASAGPVPEPAADGRAVPGEELLPVAGARFAQVPIAEVRPNPKQPRQVFDEQALAELTHSIREFGMLQPVVVRQPNGDGGGYELVMGERRLRAAATAGLTTVPAIVRTTGDEAMLRDALLENVHRAQLNPLEEAAAYQQLLEEFGATHDELAARIGRSRPQVSNTIRLLNLPIPVQRRVAAGVLSAGHARALLGIDDSDTQEELAARIVAEGLSVRATEELVALHAAGHTEKKASRRASTPRITAPALAELAERLSDAFDTRVKVELGRSKGKITIEFATIDDLERIVATMSGKLAMAGQPELDAGLGSHPGPDYSGWGDAHVSDVGAWSDPGDPSDSSEPNDS